MKYLDEYRDSAAVQKLVRAIDEAVTQPWTLMEVCGGQTHSIVRYGLDQLLPDSVSLIHGPGCPVCVTPIHLIDAAIEYSLKEGVILCTFGDMIRVPGSSESLIQAQARGANVKVVYSPLDALEVARESPEKEIIFFAVGFETTAPANAMAVSLAAKTNQENFSILCSHVLVPPAMEAILSAPENRVQGFLAAGHVCTIMGESEYPPICEKYDVPIVVTGFEPVDLLEGILVCIKKLETGDLTMSNAYKRWVRSGGNEAAIAQVREVFEVQDREWRGIGSIPLSGLELRDAYAQFDARKKLPLLVSEPGEADQTCRAGEVLCGLIKPVECPSFGTSCRPEHPLGAPMVSGEGACATYFRYRADGR